MNLKTDYSILSYRKTQKLAFFSAARPDLASSNYYFDIHILNARHTIKDLLISIKKESQKDAVINFLEKNTSLSHNIYSPDFS